MDRGRFLEAIAELEALDLQGQEAADVLHELYALVRQIAGDVPSPLLGGNTINGAPISAEDIPPCPGCNDTVAAARAYVDAGKWRRDGVRCPVCHRRNAVDQRSLDVTFVRRLVSLYMMGPGWRTCSEIYTAAGDPSSGSYGTWSIGAYWGLIEEQPNTDESRRNNATWRITQRGIDYIHRRLSIQKYAHVYHGQCLSLGGDFEGIDEAARRRFHYQSFRNYTDFYDSLTQADPWNGLTVPPPILDLNDDSGFYATYMRSPEWYAIRAQVLSRADYICENCHDQAAVQVHHLTYERLGHEDLADLLAVCIPCHESFHPDR